MFRVFNRNLQPHHYIRSPNPKPTINSLVGFLVHLQSFQLRSISTTPSSTTVDYLVNSCGLEPKTALLASQKIRLKTREKTDLVLNVLKNYDMTDTDIKELVSKIPKILKCDPDKTLKPKIEFLHSLGVSGPEIAKILMCDTQFLTKSLENKIIPAANFLKRFISNREDLFIALKHTVRFFSHDFEILVGANITTLCDYGVKECNILKILKVFPRTFLLEKNRFKAIVEEVKEMGFDPSSTLFGYAVRTMAGLSPSSWEGRWETYRKLGFSDEEILLVFKKQPFCLISSEEKIRKGVEFFTQKLKWKPADICVCPMLIRLSLENRIIPRCNVLELLNSKGVIKKELNVFLLAPVFKLSENDFLVKFVTKYQQAVPEVVDAYKGWIAGIQEEDELKAVG